ncbi:MAG TPA: cyclic nucleotide-binding domain-containing protein [Thermoanaerobaculia bacterium]|nr:cyclic nucleotide-binding domain-containing protein [Thermoanaerobaculia bacterium]
MALKGWFGGGAAKKAERELTIDDLIVVERYDEAAERLNARLKTNPDDLHSHLKLAEVYTELKQFDRAVIEYGFVAEEYAEDGFYDKGIALLSRAAKIAPNNSAVRNLIEKIQREKSLEGVRVLALAGLKRAQGGSATSALELQRLWHHLASSTLVQHLAGDQLERLFSNVDLRHVAEKETLAAERSKETALYIIVRGVVEARIRAGGKDANLRSFSSGDILGESVLLEHGEWPANYVVVESVTLLHLDREGLEQALVGNPDPRGLLDALREQRTDRAVLASARRLRAGM